MDEILVNDGRNQYGNEDIFTEDASTSATVVCI